MSIDSIVPRDDDPRLNDALLRWPDGRRGSAVGVTAAQLRFLQQLNSDEALAILGSAEAVDIVL